MQYLTCNAIFKFMLHIYNNNENKYKYLSFFVMYSMSQILLQKVETYLVRICVAQLL
jgi:hypothetical protein